LSSPGRGGARRARTRSFSPTQQGMFSAERTQERACSSAPPTVPSQRQPCAWARAWVRARVRAVAAGAAARSGVRGGRVGTLFGQCAGSSAMMFSIRKSRCRSRSARRGRRSSGHDGFGAEASQRSMQVAQKEWPQGARSGRRNTSQHTGQCRCSDGVAAKTRGAGDGGTSGARSSAFRARYGCARMAAARRREGVTGMLRFRSKRPGVVRPTQPSFTRPCLAQTPVRRNGTFALGRLGQISELRAWFDLSWADQSRIRFSELNCLLVKGKLPPARNGEVSVALSPETSSFCSYGFR
jgi:hypothetical protein